MKPNLDGPLYSLYQQRNIVQTGKCSIEFFEGQRVVYETNPVEIFLFCLVFVFAFLFFCLFGEA